MTDRSRRAPPSAEDVFNDALDQPVDRRSAYLGRACAGDADLRQRVEKLLALAERVPGGVDPPASEFEAGSRLGKYEILEVVGRGGMGVVYRGRDTTLGREVALKTLKPHLTSDSGWIERLRREAQVHAALHDDRIATLFALEVIDGVHVIVVEYVAGRTLAAVLQDESPSWSARLRYCRDIAAALEVAHARGTVHRDLKPANVMVTDEGKIKLVDFGIAKSVVHPTATEVPDAGTAAALTGLAGTPDYMSPEQLLGGTVDARSDIWAFGCVLAGCLVGEESSLPSTAAEGDASHGPLAILRRLPARTPRSLRSLVQRCLVVDPMERLDEIATARRVLDRELDGPARRRRLWLTVATGGLIVFLAAAVFVDFGPTPELTRVSQQGDDSVAAVGDDGSILWTKRFEGMVVQGNRYRDRYRPPTIVRDSRGRNSVVLMTEIDAGPCAVNLVDARDGTTLWTREISWSRPVNMQERLLANSNCAVHASSDGEPLIAIGLRDGIWYSSAVRFLDCNGNEIGTYYHPGIFTLLGELDLEDRGRGALFLYGSNSSARFIPELVPFETYLHPGMVARLDEFDGVSQAYPYSERQPEPRDWPGLPRAQERAYLVIPLLHPDCPSAVTGLTQVDTGDPAIRLQAGLEDGRIIRLGADLTPVSWTVTGGSLADSLLGAGEATIVPFLHILRGEQHVVEAPRLD